MSEDTITVGSVEHMRRVMETEAAVVTSDTRDIQNGIQQSILDAADDDAVFEAGNAGLLSGKDDMLDRPISILGFSFNRSGYQQGLPVYAVVQAVDLTTGEKVSFSLGSESACTQLYRWEQIKPMAERGGFPCALKSKDTASGNTVLTFRPLTPAERKAAGI